MLFCCWILLILCGSCGSPPAGLKSLDTVRQVRDLSVPDLRKGLPVRLQGVVTFSDDVSQMLVIQDESGGVAVDWRDSRSGVKPGSRVLIEGFTAYEGLAPMVVKPKLTLLGSGALPACVQADPARLFQGKLDYQRVEFECLAKAVHVEGSGNIEFDLEAWHHSFRARGRFISNVALELLPDSRVRIRGVPVSVYHPTGEVHSLTIQLSGEADLQLLSLPPRGNAPRPLPESGRSKSLPLLATIGQIKSLRNVQAAEGYPVRIRGIITYLDPRRNHVFIQDPTGASYIRYLPDKLGRISRGDLLLLEGWTGDGGFAPVIDPAKVRILGKAPMPAPIQVQYAESFAGKEENRWAAIEGVVQDVVEEGYEPAKVFLKFGGHMIEVLVQKSPSTEELKSLVDHQVKVQGIFAPVFTTDRRLAGFGLKTPSLEYMKVVRQPGGDTFDQPARSIHSLLEYDPAGIPRHRVKLAGRITRVDSRGTIHLADDSGGIRLEGSVSGHLKAGDPIQVLGFLNWTKASPVLQHVVVRPAEDVPESRPLVLAAGAALSSAYDNRLIEVEGFIREHSQSFGDHILTLESGRTKFTAMLEQPQSFEGSEQLRDGALVGLTGVCEIHWNEKITPASPEGMRLLLRTPEDILVLKPAPWWTVGRALGLAAGLITVLLLVTGWLVGLQRKVRARTEQLRRQMHQREALEEQLRQSQKLEGVGRLAGGVAHDFNNLLTVINGYCDMMTTEAPEGSELHFFLEEIKKAAGRAISLTKQLLAFSRKQILKPVVLDLNELVSDMDQMLGRLIGEDIQLITHIHPLPCFIKVDPGQISQVLMNLVVNARDAMPGGGQVIIETRQVMLEAQQLEAHPDVLPGTYVQLTVADSGVGMDEETLKQIFEPFFTTKVVGKGTGLGLSTVFGIVKQSGGHIWTYSEPGHGTAFKLFFPSTSEPEDLEIAGEAVISRGGGETVLVVEDQEEVRRFVQKSLEAQGYKILPAEKVDEALKIVHQHTGPIHLLLTDVVMPGMNGKELAAQVLVLRPEVRVLYMSGYTEDTIVHQGVLDTGIAFIQKPFSTKELANRVAETLHM